MLGGVNLREAHLYTPLTLKNEKNDTESGNVVTKLVRGYLPPPPLGDV